MPKYFIKLHTGYVGMDGYELIEADNLDEANEAAYYMAFEHATMYGVELCPNGDDCEDDECEYEHPGNNSIEGSAELYDPEKHDMYLR